MEAVTSCVTVVVACVDVSFHLSVSQLTGYDEEAVLQVYIGNDAGKVRPHNFYQVCATSVRNGAVPNEKIVNGTNVIEVLLSPDQNMTAR